MSVEVDDRGRVYLSKSIREKHGERFRVLDLSNRVVLIPIDEDPLQAARNAVGDVFEDRSAREVKHEALMKAKAEVEAEAEERERMRREYEGA